MKTAAPIDSAVSRAPLTTNPPSTAARPIVVVGGGVIGAACAYYLAKAGCSVLLIERGKFAGGCSHGNCGYVSPSHILPLCKPGAISSSFKTLFQRNSPFKIRPRLDLQTWSWFYRFARRCNVDDMMTAGYARQALLDSSRSLYQNLMEDKTLGDCDWDTRGLLFVHQDPAHFESFGKTDKLLREEFGLGAKRLDAKELLELEPALKPVVAGAWLYECDAHLRPDMLMASWKNRLLQQGVVIRENCQFLGMEQGDNGIQAIQTSSGRIATDHVVFATGAWSRQIQKQLGISIPIEPGKGYSITMKRPERCPVYPMIFEDHRVAITPSASAYRIGSTMEFAGFDETLRDDRLQLLTDAAKLYLHTPLDQPVVEKWYGWRPMSCDGVPMIGPVPRMKNVWLAAGHSMLGLSMATATGKLVTEMLTRSTPHIDPQPYRLDRF